VVYYSYSPSYKNKEKEGNIFRPCLLVYIVVLVALANKHTTQYARPGFYH
jgi:hypothetical protein